MRGANLAEMPTLGNRFFLAASRQQTIFVAQESTKRCQVVACGKAIGRAMAPILYSSSFRLARLGPVLGLATLALACLQIASPFIGPVWHTPVSLALLAGVFLLQLLPQRRFTIGLATAMAVLLQTTSLRLLGYVLVLLSLAFWLRRRPWTMAALLVAGVVVIPKGLFQFFYHRPVLHDWVNATLLGQVFYVSALWWRERQEGRPQIERFDAWASLTLFPAFAATPVAMSPSLIWQERRREWKAVAETVLLVVSKALAVWAIDRFLPELRFANLSSQRLLGLSATGLWSVLVVNYLRHALALSGTFDLVVATGRLLGWPLPNGFRWALLAWNPVELWRRWSVYSRKLLLKLVYFPLGGGDRHRLRNVMLTFLASGLVLHSGWIGSPYWAVNLAGLRDWTVYFLLQGISVCACLVWWRWRGKDPREDRNLRLSGGRVVATIFTQATTVWLHVPVLAAHVPWLDRWRLMARSTYAWMQ